MEKMEYLFMVVDEVKQGDNLTFKGNTVHKTKEGETPHITNCSFDAHARDNITIRFLVG